MKARVLATMALAAVLAVASAAPASAVSTSQVITGQYLELVSTADTAVMANMLPGDEVAWTVSVSADAPEPGVVDVALSGTGELPLSVVVRACNVEWDDGLCAPGATVLRERATVALDGHSEHLLRFDAATAQHLRLDVALAESSDAPSGETELRVLASGFGDEVEATPPGEGELPETGLRIGGVLLMALGAIVAGIAGASLLSRKDSPTL